MIERNPEWITARIDDEIVMMSVENGTYLGLNAVGARIWDLLETPHDADSLCSALVGEFEVAPGTCRAELVSFLAELGAIGAVSSR